MLVGRQLREADEEDLDDEEKIKIMVDMSQAIMDVNSSANGTKTDFTHDFVRGVCSETIC